MRKLVIVGNGGFAKEVAWLVGRINAVKPTWKFLGFIDHCQKLGNVVGDDDFVINYEQEIYVTIAIGDPKIRETIYKK